MGGSQTTQWDEGSRVERGEKGRIERMEKPALQKEERREIKKEKMTRRQHAGSGSRRGTDRSQVCLVVALRHTRTHKRLAGRLRRATREHVAAARAERTETAVLGRGGEGRRVECACGRQRAAAAVSTLAAVRRAELRPPARPPAPLFSSRSTVRPAFPSRSRAVIARARLALYWDRRPCWGAPGWELGNPRLSR